MSKKKSTIYTILIICEGENTEPLFFDSIRNEVMEKRYDIGNVKINILPESTIENNNISKYTEKSKRPQRTTKKVSVEPETIKGEPPLKWVLAGKENLKDGIYDEVWVVFDHDEHPRRKEAFESAEEIINDKKVQIAFSSRSFEYYLLLNFERKYFYFNKTECKTSGKNPKSIECGTYINKNDCNGKKCINGYARLNKYWDNSKTKNSIFPLVKDSIVIGFENSSWLRYKSDSLSLSPIYDRNPYTTTDALVKRLTGYENILFKWIDLDKENRFGKFSIYVSKSNKSLTFKNLSDTSFIIPEKSFCLIDSKNKRSFFGEKIIIEPEKEIICKIDKNEDSFWYILSIENFRIMFEFIIVNN